MAKNKKHSTPSTDLLRRYVAGTLSPMEQHQLEKAALQNEQIDDTLEGLQALKAANVDEKAALEDLTQRLRQRVRKSERKLLPYYYASAAAVVLTVGLSWWLIQKEGVPEADTVSSTIALEKERAVLKPEAAPATIESKPPTFSGPMTAARKPSLSKPSGASQIQQSADAEKMQQTESPAPNLALEEKKNEVAAPPTVPEAVQTQNAQQIVAVQPKMFNPSRDASAPAPVESTQDLDTVRVVAAKSKAPTKEVTGAVAISPQGRAKKENVFTLQGKVLDAGTQEPLPGVTLSFKGHSQGVITDAEGKFVLPYVQKNDKISVSFVGFQTLQMTVKDSLTAPILLEADQKVLSEVVVTGYGKSKPVNREASPKNGQKVYENYLKTSADAFIAQNPQAPRGRVVLNFTVKPSGELSDFKNMNKANTVLFEEAMRMVKIGDAWNPPLKNGQPEVGKVRLVIRFE
jgi:hypothetical protein